MAEKAAGKKAASKRVMDVSRPGKSAPPASSRPVIVGHKPMIKDPMVSEKGATPATLEEPVKKKDDEAEQITVRRSAKVIAPIDSKEAAEPASADNEPAADQPADPPKAEAAEADAPAPEEKTAEPEEPETEAPAETTEEQPAAEEEAETEEEKPEDADQATSDDAATVGAVADQVKDKKKAAKETEEERKKQEALDKLIEDKKYFVPLGQVTKRRHTEWTLVFLLLLVLGALAFWYVVDAGLFDPGFKLPFDLIKN